MTLPARGQFQPRFVLASELRQYGLPDQTKQADILSLVDAASTLIDEYCGRTDGNGQGSLVYTTYAERILFQASGRNIVRVSFKPMVAIDATTYNTLVASANSVPTNPAGNPDLGLNYFWTGCLQNLVTQPDGSLSSIIAASGRYGYGRRNSYAIYPDLNYGMNPLQVASFFGGPPTWTLIDAGAIDWDKQTQSGEIWVPAGLYLSQYTEMIVVYNAGYHPLMLPRAIKQSCAALVRNFLARGGGTTGIKGIQAAGSINVQFTDALIDDTIARWLDAYRNVIAY